MNWLDIVILVVAGFVALSGWRMGGVQIAATGIGILAGIALTSRLDSRVEPFFADFIDSENGAQIAAFIAIFLVTIILAGVAGVMLRSVLKGIKLGWMDQMVGLSVGVIVAFAIGSVVLSSVQSYPILGLEETIEDSALGTFLADNFDTVLRGLKFVPGDLGNK